MTLIDPEEYKNASENDSSYAAFKLKTPKRVLHFSDGILEEYSDDEVDCSPKEVKAVIDPTTLTWGPWTWYKMWSACTTTVSYLDTAGEFMASVLGITSPKYYFELEEYKKRSAEAAAENAQKAGWSEPSGNPTIQDIEFTDIRVSQPAPANVV